MVVTQVHSLDGINYYCDYQTFKTYLDKKINIFNIGQIKDTKRLINTNISNIYYYIYGFNLFYQLGDDLLLIY